MTQKPYPFTAEQEAWLLDLETTEEPQTRGALHRLIDEEDDETGDVLYHAGFCCLGRACIVLGLETSKAAQDGTAFYGEKHNNTTAPYEVWQPLKLRDESGSIDSAVRISLAEMNDNGVSFKDIAKYIRKNPNAVFLPDSEQ